MFTKSLPCYQPIRMFFVHISLCYKNKFENVYNNLKTCGVECKQRWYGQITLRIMGYHFSSQLTATPNHYLIYFKITWALAIILEHMHKKFKINLTKIKSSCRLGRKVVFKNSENDLPLVYSKLLWYTHRCFISTN